MRLTSRLGESIYLLENIKELWILLGKYSYQVPNIEGNGFTLTQLKEVPEMEAENNSWALSADLYLIELLQGRLKLCEKRAAAWHIYSDQVHDSLGCLTNVPFVYMNKGFIGPSGKLSSGKWPYKSGDWEGREISKCSASNWKWLSLWLLSKPHLKIAFIKKKAKIPLKISTFCFIFFPGSRSKTSLISWSTPLLNF